VPSVMTRWIDGLGLLHDRRRRVVALVADSDPVSQSLFARLLDAQGYQAVIASSAAEAFQKFTCWAPSFVLLDVNLPDVPAAVLIRQFAETRARVPVIVLTSTIDSHVSREAVRSGATKLLEKDTPTDALREAIDAVLSESSRPHALPVSGRGLRLNSRELTTGSSDAVERCKRLNN